MKTWAKLTVTCLAIIGAATWLIVGVYGIWPPDMDGRKLTIVAATAADGTQLRVEQFWNHVDFYSTLLRVTAPGGKPVEYVIDGDDRKQWHGEIRFTDHIARVILGGEERRAYDLQARGLVKGRSQR